ncbi:MAG: autorepressor SdpR family transcription factor [Coriobacteriia bacterium]|nr:autorepressor SdpR family transcription factor [Coriobacteriia bacterium]
MQGDVFKALADPTRRGILALLQRGDLTAGTIADNFDMSKPSISHHLSALKHAGLVAAERRGQEIVYSLDTTVFQDLLAYTLGFLGEKDEGGSDR